MAQQFNHMTDDLLVKYLLGEASAGEEKEVLDWIAAGESNKKYFDQFKLIWDTSKELSSKTATDENAAWERFQQRVNNKGKAPAPVRKVFFKPWMRIAATIILLMGIGAVLYSIFNNVTAPKELYTYAEKQVKQDTLPDGSTVTLNKRSLISYPSKFRGNKREVVLKGEAFFNVAPDKKKPFIIHSNDVDITVVGTTFNVKNIDSNTEVVVETGIVRVTKNGQTVELHPGERTTITREAKAPVKEEVTDKLYNYYRTREFVCKNTPLWKLVDVINEAYDVNIIIKNEAKRNLEIDSPFYNVSLKEALDVITQTLDVKVVYNGNQIILE